MGSSYLGHPHAVLALNTRETMNRYIIQQQSNNIAQRRSARAHGGGKTGKFRQIRKPKKKEPAYQVKSKQAPSA
jgi:hypothetical protein